MDQAAIATRAAAIESARSSLATVGVGLHFASPGSAMTFPMATPGSASPGFDGFPSISPHLPSASPGTGSSGAFVPGSVPPAIDQLLGAGTFSGGLREGLGFGSEDMLSRHGGMTGPMAGV